MRLMVGEARLRREGLLAGIGIMPIDHPQRLEDPATLRRKTRRDLHDMASRMR